MSCGSLLMPNTTFGFVLNRNASSPQNSANCSVVAAVGSLVLPITCMIQTCEKTKVEIDYQHTLPVLGCCDGSLSRDQRSNGDKN